MILQLSKNITVKREENEKPIGDLVFNKTDFALFVDIANLDVFNDSFNIVFRVIRKEDNRILEQVGLPVNIAKDGRNGSITNSKQIADYVAAKKKLQGEIKDTRQSINDIQKDIKPLRISIDLIREELSVLKADLFQLQQIQEPTDGEIKEIKIKEETVAKKESDLKLEQEALGVKQTELSAKNDLLTSLQTQLESMIEVLPVYEKLDKYGDIVGNQIVNNKLTEEGLKWVKGLPLLKSTVGDYIV